MPTSESCHLVWFIMPVVSDQDQVRVPGCPESSLLGLYWSGQGQKGSNGSHCPSAGHWSALESSGQFKGGSRGHGVTSGQASGLRVPIGQSSGCLRGLERSVWSSGDDGQGMSLKRTRNVDMYNLKLKHIPFLLSTSLSLSSLLPSHPMAELMCANACCYSTTSSIQASFLCLPACLPVCVCITVLHHQPLHRHSMQYITLCGGLPCSLLEDTSLKKQLIIINRALFATDLFGFESERVIGWVTVTVFDHRVTSHACQVQSSPAQCILQVFYFSVLI